MGYSSNVTPSTDGRAAFADPTHVSFWNVLSWVYYVRDEYRKLYDIKAKFAVVELNDMVTNEEFKIIHTKGIFRAMK